MSKANFRRSKLKPAVLMLALCFCANSAGQATLARGSSQPPAAPKLDEKPVFELAEKLGKQPELMTPEYLKYLLGHPIKRDFTNVNMTFHWQTAAGGIGTQYCTLTERRDANHRLVQAIMRIDLPQSDVTLVEVEKRIEGEKNPNNANANGTNPFVPANSYGFNGTGSLPPYGAPIAGMPGTMPPPMNGGMINAPGGLNAAGAPGSGTLQPSQMYGAPGGPNGLGALSGSLSPPYQDYNQKPHGKKLFDQECRPSLRYSFVPNTFVTYTQSHTSSYVHRIEIAYAGPPLPAPSELEMESAAIGMRTRAIGHQSKDLHNIAVPMLHDHIADNPADAEAHYYLGLSYQKTGNLNNAIGEYQTALRYSWNNPDIAQKASQSLQQLHVLPNPDDKFDFHDLKFKDKGQGLAEGDVTQTQDRQTILATSTAGNFTPGSYMGANDMPLLFTPGTGLLAPMGGTNWPAQPQMPPSISGSPMAPPNSFAPPSSFAPPGSFAPSTSFAPPSGSRPLMSGSPSALSAAPSLAGMPSSSQPPAPLTELKAPPALSLDSVLHPTHRPLPGVSTGTAKSASSTLGRPGVGTTGASSRQIGYQPPVPTNTATPSMGDLDLTPGGLLTGANKFEPGF